MVAFGHNTGLIAIVLMLFHSMRGNVCLNIKGQPDPKQVFFVS